jgi:hypothetical protein
VTELTRTEQETAAARIRQWPADDRRALLALPPRERDIVVLATVLLDARPGFSSNVAKIIEVP